LRGLSLLAFGAPILGLPLFAVFYGLGWIGTVPPTLRLATNVFGRATGVTMFAWILAGHQLGTGLTAYLAGLARTWASSYDVPFITSGMLCMIAALIVLFVGRSAIVAKPVPA
jgi:sugar phosphate permease